MKIQEGDVKDVMDSEMVLKLKRKCHKIDFIDDYVGPYITEWILSQGCVEVMFLWSI